MRTDIEHISSELVILRPTGRMDAESAPSTRELIFDQINRGVKNLIVDLVHVDFMDSSGLSVLVTGMKSLSRVGGKIGICNANPQIRTALHLTMLDQVLPPHDNLEAALLTLHLPPVA